MVLPVVVLLGELLAPQVLLLANPLSVVAVEV